MDYSVYYLSNSSEIYEYKTNHGIVDFTTQQKIYQESSTNNVLWRQNNSNELITLSAPSLPKLNGIAVIEH